MACRAAALVPDPDRPARCPRSPPAGGGCTLLRLSGLVDEFKNTLSNDEQRVGGVVRVRVSNNNPEKNGGWRGVAAVAGHGRNCRFDMDGG